MSHSQNHGYECGRPSESSCPNAASFEATGRRRRGQSITDNRNHIRSRIDGIQQNQNMGGPAILNHPPTPAGFQIPEKGLSFATPGNPSSIMDTRRIQQYENGRPSRNQHNQGPARFQVTQQWPSIENPQRQDYAGVGQISHRLICKNPTSANTAVPPNPRAAEDYLRTRGPDSWTRRDQIRTANTPSVQEGNRAHPIRHFVPRVPRYNSPQNILGNEEKEEQGGTGGRPSLTPSLSYVDRMQTTERRFYPTNQVAQYRDRQVYGAQRPTHEPNNPLLQLDRIGRFLRNDVIPKYHSEKNKAVEARDIQAKRDQLMEGNLKRKRMENPSPEVEEDAELSHKRTKIEHHSPSLHRTANFAPSSGLNSSRRLDSHLHPNPPKHADSPKRSREDSLADQEEELAQLPKGRSIQPGLSRASDPPRPTQKGQQAHPCLNHYFEENRRDVIKHLRIEETLGLGAEARAKDKHSLASRLEPRLKGWLGQQPKDSEKRNNAGIRTVQVKEHQAKEKIVAEAPIPPGQLHENIAYFVTRSRGSGTAQASLSKASDRHLLTAEEVAPMTFWLRRAIKPCDAHSCNQSTSFGRTMPEDRESGPSQMTNAQYAELTRPLTKQEIEEWFAAFGVEYAE